MLQYDSDARRQLVRERAADLATDYEVSRPPPTRRPRRTALGLAARWLDAVHAVLDRAESEQVPDSAVGSRARGS
jgi:hypothetical protein